jgi:hypothetical protein
MAPLSACVDSRPRASRAARRRRIPAFAQLLGQRHAAREEDADALLDRQIRIERAIARTHDHVAEIQVIGRHVHREQPLRPAAAVDREFLGQESQQRAARLILDEHDALEAELVGRRERFEQLLDRRIDRAKHRHLQQQRFGAAEHAAAHHVRRDGANHQHDHGGRHDAEPRHIATDHTLRDPAGQPVGELEHPDQRHDADHQRHGDEEAGQEGTAKPLPHARSP